MKPENVDKILAEIDERIEVVEGKNELAETRNQQYVVAHFDGQIFALAYVREMIEAYRRGEKESEN
jgi:hypothetical protein